MISGYYRENDTQSLMIFAFITASMVVIPNTSDNRILTKWNLVLYVSQPGWDATKNVAHSVNYEVKQK